MCAERGCDGDMSWVTCAGGFNIFGELRSQPSRLGPEATMDAAVGQLVASGLASAATLLCASLLRSAFKCGQHPAAVNIATMRASYPCTHFPKVSPVQFPGNLAMLNRPPPQHMHRLLGLIGAGEVYWFAQLEPPAEQHTSSPCNQVVGLPYRPSELYCLVTQYHIGPCPTHCR